MAHEFLAVIFRDCYHYRKHAASDFLMQSRARRFDDLANDLGMGRKQLPEVLPGPGQALPVRHFCIKAENDSARHIRPVQLLLTGQIR